MMTFRSSLSYNKAKNAYKNFVVADCQTASQFASPCLGHYKAMMKIFSTITISLIASFSFASELTKLNAAWLLQNEKTISNQLQASSDIEVMPIINTLGIIWQNREGAIGSEVSPYIAQALIYKSDNMLAWFNKHPKSLETWLQNIVA